MSDRAEAHYRAAARYMKADPNHPKAKAHMMRWGALRFGALDVDHRLESWDTMLRKYSEFSVTATNVSIQGTSFPNDLRGVNDQAMYERYKSGEFGSKVILDNYIKREWHGSHR